MDIEIITYPFVSFVFCFCFFRSMSVPMAPVVSHQTPALIISISISHSLVLLQKKRLVIMPLKAGEKENEAKRKSFYNATQTSFITKRVYRLCLERYTQL